MTTKRYVPILGMALLAAVSLIAGEATAFVNNPPGIAVEVGVLESWVESPDPPPGSTPIPVSRGRSADGVPFYLLSPAVDPIDNVPISIRLVNTSGGALYLPVGFKTRRFHLDLVFTDPDGKSVTANELFTTPATDPPPPPVLFLGGQLVPAQPVELFAVNESILYRLRNAQGPFTLNKPGLYSVRAVIHNSRTYLQADYLVGSSLNSLLANSNWNGALVSDSASFYLAADRDGDRYYAPVAYDLGLDCDDNNPAVNPGAYDLCKTCAPPPGCVTVPKATLVIRAEKHTVGLGSYPGSTKEPLTGINIRVFDKSPGSCAFKAGTSWHSYPQIYSTCPSAKGGEGAATDASGKVTFYLDPGDYLAIGYYDPNRVLPGDEVYPGVSVGTMVAGTTTNKYFQVIAKADGKNVPGKYTIVAGSELMIIEPEYVEWTGAQELYPFIFQASGDWTVTTSISPPEGFVADQKSLSAEVVNALQTVQFLVTDIGSEWVDTGVVHLVRHKGKERSIKSHVGVINKKEKKEEKKEKKQK